MKITIEFGSMDEFNAHFHPDRTTHESKGSESTEKVKDTVGPEMSTQGTTEPENEPAPEVPESFRIEVRKTLSALNKATGKNIASALIKTFGVDKLTEVALSDLPELMKKAEEALANATK